jgi:hypothetical protein
MAPHFASALSMLYAHSYCPSHHHVCLCPWPGPCFYYYVN